MTTIQEDTSNTSCSEPLPFQPCHCESDLRLHSDKFRHLHSNGDLHILAFCSLFHLRVILIAVEQSPRVAAPPLGMGPKREKKQAPI